MTSSVFGIAKDLPQAESIITALHDAGFLANDVSVLYPDRSGGRDFGHESHTKAPEGATSGGVAGGVLGGALGWLVGAGLLAIPGLGPFIAAGPIMAALGGAALGATAGGVTGGLIGLGIPEMEAKRYEGKLRDGNILIAVHALDSDHEKTAKEILRSRGASDIADAGEKSPPTAETVRPTSRVPGPSRTI